VIVFKGHIKNDSTITGTFHQRGFHFPFKMKRKTTKIARQKSLPYHHKKIIIKNDSIKIGGTLTRPKDHETNQLVITISGSGPQNRNSNYNGFKIFGQIADYLTRHDIAVFRYDDRGVGESTGNFRQAGLNKLSSDVKAILAYFSKNPEYSFTTFTLLGHSQGGYIAGRVAASDSLVDKIILMSSPAVSLEKILVYQAGEGASLEKAMLDTLLGSQNYTQIIDTVVKRELKEYKSTPDSAKKRTLTNPKKFFYKQMEAEVQNMKKPWIFSFLGFDPAEDLSKLDIPVLALFGGKDIQVPDSLNVEPMVAALDSANVSYQINRFKNANHLYQKAKTGLSSEYTKLPTKFIKGFLPTITQWIKRTGRKK
jgi:pimeloyl-ACP methyl ester carboxylesterase